MSATDILSNDERPPLEQPPPDVYARLRAAMQEEKPLPPPVRPRWTVLALVSITLAVLAVDGLLRHRAFVRVDAESALGICLPSAIGAIAVALLTTLIAISGGRHGLGERVSVLRWTAISVVPLSIIPMAFLVQPGQPVTTQVHPWGLPCLLMGTAIAALSLWILHRRLRASVPVSVGWRSATIGAAAGAWSGFGLLVHCPAVEIQHLVIGHLAPIAMFPILGVLIARRRIRI